MYKWSQSPIVVDMVFSNDYNISFYLFFKNEVLSSKQQSPSHGRSKGVELKIFIDCTGYDSIGCG